MDDIDTSETPKIDQPREIASIGDIYKQLAILGE